MENTQPSTTNIHKGHRQRLKNKVRENGLKALSTHEALELLLTYTIPQKDTNKLAHTLLLEFGNFANVLDATYDELRHINGVGEETALFLSTLPSFVELYKSNKISTKNHVLNTSNDCVNYFRNNFELRSHEHLYFTLLNKLKRVIRTFVIEGNDDCTITLDMQYITSRIAGDNVDSVIIFHTHPNGSVRPSNDDLVTTQNLLNLFCMLQIKLCDHIILNETSYYSFHESGELSKMMHYICQVFPNINRASLILQQKAIEEFGSKPNTPSAKNTKNKKYDQPK